MGHLRPTSREQIRKAASVYRERLPDQRETKILNSDLIIGALAVDSILSYRSIRYRVPPVGYKDGLRLQKLYRRSEEIARAARSEKHPAGVDDDVTEADLSELYGEMAALFHSLVRPTTIFQRVFWRWLPNPFANVTEADVIKLMGFFFTCRTKSTVRSSSAQSHQNSTI